MHVSEGMSKQPNAVVIVLQKGKLLLISVDLTRKTAAQRRQTSLQ